MRMTTRWKSVFLPGQLVPMTPPPPRPLPSQDLIFRKEKWATSFEFITTVIPDRHYRRKDRRRRRQCHPVAATEAVEDDTIPISTTIKSSQLHVACRLLESSSMESKTTKPTAPAAVVTLGPRPLCLVAAPFLLVCLRFLFRSRPRRGVRGQLRRCAYCFYIPFY